MDHDDVADAVSRCCTVIDGGLMADPAMGDTAIAALHAYKKGVEDAVNMACAACGDTEPTPGAVAKAVLRQRTGGNPHMIAHLTGMC